MTQLTTSHPFNYQSRDLEARAIFDPLKQGFVLRVFEKGRVVSEELGFVSQEDVADNDAQGTGLDLLGGALDHIVSGVQSGTYQIKP